MASLNEVYAIIEPYFAEIVIAVLIAVFNKRIRKGIRFAAAYVNDKPIKMQLQVVQKYGSAPQAFLDNSVFSEMQGRITSDAITKDFAKPHLLRVHSEALGMGVSISLDEPISMSEVGTMEQASVLGHYVNIRADAEIIGVRRIDDTTDFVNIATKAAESINSRCFQSSRPEQTFATCDIKNFLRKSTTGVFEDKKLGARISLHDSVISIVADEPNNIPRIVKSCLWRLT